MPDPFIDLHAHSSVSDGTERPAELVRAAAAAGLDAVALTDHDTTAGWADATAAARELPLTLLPGLELSTRIGYRSVHVLGYLVDPEHPGLVEETTRIRDGRLSRAHRMVDRIAEDHPITWADVLAQSSPGATIGRPHIADALVARGLESDRSAAFRGILHPASGYYEPHEAPSPLRGVELIRQAGGVPVIAHPAASSRGIVIDEPMLRDLVDAGLGGLEVDHRENLAHGKRTLLDWATRYGLFVTGSSDYHGTGKPNRLGEHRTARVSFDTIVSEATGSAPVVGPGSRLA
ncbi:PHP domain-containing protein [Curtobacterium aurantiacum]|uniref:PHP domain-containing protein n=1 Tax=Curtobacterium aurantiacum TaxID=3236919 RepID=A0ABS5VD27_9MICO|nr:PHP domain-containing protein [Curtobacterium flaccumfaciens]MBT1544972.1 PHP domain-containing protein [Curtobacterium flaccumfaciens pv. flaccumfaciens]MBT1587395.1 PHP domain-containing protein [Curtobacterium flaccumfaciens pv. flaccumfaciens]MBT1676853.1 PHP domain-containing protein [Curtobacterium flaccumfaciens pv. flaccumfaciens]MBT1678738.1 PHP domain-containing protein [Curtobacterium flaccumfaciens pv. flaccumfaciens]